MWNSRALHIIYGNNTIYNHFKLLSRATYRMDVSLKTENITLKKMANTHYSIALATSTVFQFERHVT